MTKNFVWCNSPVFYWKTQLSLSMRHLLLSVIFIELEMVNNDRFAGFYAELTTNYNSRMKYLNITEISQTI